MASLLGDVGSMLAAELLSNSGSDWTYSRGATTGTLNFHKSDLPPAIVDNGKGQATEITMASFRGLVSEFEALFAKPQTGDKITNGTLTYGVQPVLDKCFYVVDGMMHIHAKRISG